ncbi:uncharacterized protein LOC124824361 [Vigna umbellata]|uniref:uncharacterized protein LOC124824361 n=1 Tax=Vigna umbellata TaxID=87088 RepID=UPI001F5E43E9|nr:uncharacterized protein LOC124824361 [Vigna umbellata]
MDVHIRGWILTSVKGQMDVDIRSRMLTSESRVHSLDTVTKPKPGGFSSGKAAKKKKQPKDDPRTVENGLRFNFMEELMDRARNRDSNDVSEVIYDMIAASLNPDPRSFHGLVVSHTLNGHEEAVMESLRRELAAGLQSVHETFMALVRLFGSKGRAIRGLEILGDMQDLYYDIR